MYARKSNKKNILLVALALMLIVGLIGGTMAWLTAQDNVENVFTVGNIDKPKQPVDPSDPNKPVDPDDGKYNDGETELKGNIIEPDWIESEEHKMVPGASFDKNPQIGIGPKSEAAYVFAWVIDASKYNIGETAYNGALIYTINECNDTNREGWLKVEDPTTDMKGYSALYVWATWDETAAQAVATALKPVSETTESVTTTKSAWTNPLFDKVTVNGDATSIEQGNMTVHCFIHQAIDGDNNSLYDTATSAASAAYKPTTNP